MKTLLYDTHIMDEQFRDVANQFPPVDASLSIEESVDGDIRIFLSSRWRVRP